MDTLLTFCEEDGRRSFPMIIDGICMNANPSLSSVRPNFTKGAYMAAKLIERAIRHPNWRGRHVVCPPEGITRRESTRFILRHDPEVAAAIDIYRVCRAPTQFAPGI